MLLNRTTYIRSSSAAAAIALITPGCCHSTECLGLRVTIPGFYHHALLPHRFHHSRRRSQSTLAAAGETAAAAVTGGAKELDELVSLAPMLEYTDRHMRYLLRLMTNKMVLYTEMVTANTLYYNEESHHRFLHYNAPEEHPVVLQLGGADPRILAEACRLAAPYAYDAINLNCGCPSDKVAGSGCFGAALMRDPRHIGDLCSAMAEGVGGKIPITVKCRIGVDDDDSYEQLRNFVATVASQSPVRHFVIHARKAILGGISPEQNRKIPPLKYPFVYKLVEEFPDLRFTLNGGVLSYEDIDTHLAHGVSGVMVGRAITARPFYWSHCDERIYGTSNPGLNRAEILSMYAAYAEAEEKREGPRMRRLMAKHIHNLFAGEPMGKRFRVALDQSLLNKELGIREVIESAMAVVPYDLLEVRPGSPSVSAPEAVRH